MSEQASDASARQLGLTAVTDLLGPDVTRSHQMSTPRQVSVDFACDPAAWCDVWRVSGSTHHSSIGASDRTEELRIVADPLGIGSRLVQPD